MYGGHVLNIVKTFSIDLSVIESTRIYACIIGYSQFAGPCSVAQSAKSDAAITRSDLLCRRTAHQQKWEHESSGTKWAMKRHSYEAFNGDIGV